MVRINTRRPLRMLLTVEDEEEARPLENDDFVTFVLERHESLRRQKHKEKTIYLGRAEPLMFALENIHLGVEGIEVFVAKHLVVDQVELASRVIEGVAVALTGEIHPSSNVSFSSLAPTYSGCPNSLPSKFRYASPPSEWTRNLL